MKFQQIEADKISFLLVYRLLVVIHTFRYAEGTNFVFDLAFLVAYVQPTKLFREVSTGLIYSKIF